MNLTNALPHVEEESVSDDGQFLDAVDDDFLEVTPLDAIDAERTVRDEAIAAHGHISNGVQSGGIIVSNGNEDESVPSRKQSINDDARPLFEKAARETVNDSGDTQKWPTEVEQNSRKNISEVKRAAPSVPTKNVSWTDDVVDGDGKLYKCSVCDMHFARHSSLVWHARSHEMNSIVRGKKTDQYDSATVENSGRKSSFRGPILELSGLFMCGYCNLEFDSARSVKLHITLSHKSESGRGEILGPFICGICDREFVSQKAMKVHVAHTHSRNDTEYPNENGLFSCGICLKQFVSTRARNVHLTHMHRPPETPGDNFNTLSMNSSSNEFGLFSCNFCHKEFQSLVARKIHMSLMHKSLIRLSETHPRTPPPVESTPNDQFSCDYCDKVFDSLKGKSVHNSHMHKSAIRSKDTIEAHTDTFLSTDSVLNEDGPLKCDYCEKEFDSLKGRRVHISRSHKFEAPEDPEPDDENSSSFNCDICFEEFGSAKAVKIHVWHRHRFASAMNGAINHSEDSSASMGSTLNVSVGLFSCELCDKAFDSARALKIHVSHMHKFVTPNGDVSKSSPSEHGPYHCEFCGREFITLKALRIHKSHKHAFTSGLYYCDTCDKGFVSLRAKKIHVTRAHTDSTSNDVSMESDGGQDVGRMQRRFLEPVTVEEKIFACHLCDRSFDCKKGLSRHVGYHKSAMKMFNDIEGDTHLMSTDDSIVDASNLSAEESTVDSIPCSHCDKVFETKKALKIHSTRKHVGTPLELDEETNPAHSEGSDPELPFACHFCERKFRNRKARSVHTVRMHKLSSRSVELYKSLLTEREVRVLVCTLCEHSSFETVQALNMHIMMEHKNEDSFACIFCQQIFSTVQSYNLHFQGICGRAQNVNGVYKFPCGECSDIFSHPKILQQHSYADHTREKENEPVQNDSVETALIPEEENLDASADVEAQASQLETHNDTDTSVKSDHEGENYDCPFCPKQFFSAKGRCAHMKVHIRGRHFLSHRKYGSVKTAANNQEVDGADNHGEVNVINPSEEMGFACKICFKSFPTEKFRNLHARVHSRSGGHTVNSASTRNNGEIVQLTKSVPFKCSQCPKAFEKRKALSNHSRIHEFCCQLCPRAFMNSKALKAHMKIHRGSNYSNNESVMTVDVEEVGRPDDNVDMSPKVNIQAVREHQADVPTADSVEVTECVGEFRCLWCPRSFTNFRALSCHSRIHTRGKDGVPTPKNPNIAGGDIKLAEFQCTVCLKVFLNAKAVAVHSRIHKYGDSFHIPADETVHSSVTASEIADQPREYTCSICSKTFPTRRGLCFHSNVHYRADYKCSHCGKRFDNVKGFAGHMKTHRGESKKLVEEVDAEIREEELDEDVKSFPCNICDRVFTSHRGYARHSWTHNTHAFDTEPEDDAMIEEPPGEKKPFACRYCGIKFSNGKQLGGHMRHHTRVLQKNPNAYSSILVDTDGMDVELNEEDQLICDTCDEVFECREDLSEHVRNHTSDPLLSAENAGLFDASMSGQPPHGYMMCHVCDRLFSSRKSLNAHMCKKHKWASRRTSPVRIPSATSSGDQNRTAPPTGSRKRSFSPDVVDVESNFMDDPIRVSSIMSKRVRSTCEAFTADTRRNGSPAGARLAFSMRNNGEIYAKNQTNLSAQFRDTAFECMYCDGRYPSKAKLLEHARTHAAAQECDEEELEHYATSHNREHFVVQNREGAEERFSFEQFDNTDGYRCSECDDTFRDKLQMLIHMCYHMDNKSPNDESRSLLVKADSTLLAPYKCNFCSQRFINKKYRNLHLCKHHRGDILQCDICQKLFICQETLKQHYDQHAQDKRFQCEYCGKCFRSKPSLKMHSQLQCDVRYGGTSPNANTNNQTAQHDPEIIIDHHFIKEEPLEEYERRHEDGEVSAVSLRLSNAHSMNTAAFSGEESRDFDIVEQKFKTENTGMLSFICECCSKRFATEMDVQTHENQPQKILFCCGLCNLYFIDSKNAELHSKMHIVESDLDLDG